jgi:hypothetical protein
MLAEGHGSSLGARRVLLPHSLGSSTAVTRAQLPELGPRRAMGSRPAARRATCGGDALGRREATSSGQARLLPAPQGRSGRPGTPSIITSSRAHGGVFGPARDPGEPSRRSTRTSPRRCRRGSRRIPAPRLETRGADRGPTSAWPAGRAERRRTAVFGRRRPSRRSSSAGGGDSRIAVGAAFHVWHQGLGRRVASRWSTRMGTTTTTPSAPRRAGSGGLDAGGSTTTANRAGGGAIAGRRDVVGWFQGAGWSTATPLGAILIVRRPAPAA